MKINHIHQGDCRDVMATMGADSIDAIVCDPPYGLQFMGKGWDHGVPDVDYWTAALRVAKPGAHLLAFGGTRMFHRLMVAIEDAGWEIRDTLGWIYGQGFPKSKNLDGDWKGWGTALKPAWEPIVVARKPLIGTVMANVMAHGTGAINIDGCRIPIDAAADASQLRTMNVSQHDGADGWGMNTLGPRAGAPVLTVAGRWPANLIIDGSDEVIALFPSEAGAAAPVTVRNGDKFRNSFGAFGGDIDEAGSTFRGDSGSAARFFYCAKASRADRNEGLEGRDKKALNWSSGTQNPGSFQAEGTDRTSENHHPTVKPTELMRYLCRLVTPPRGLILDPFAGSGSTGKAAVLEGFRFVGIELEAEYVDIARARIEAAIPRQQGLGFA